MSIHFFYYFQARFQGFGNANRECKTSEAFGFGILLELDIFSDEKASMIMAVQARYTEADVANQLALASSPLGTLNYSLANSHVYKIYRAVPFDEYSTA